MNFSFYEFIVCVYLNYNITYVPSSTCICLMKRIISVLKNIEICYKFVNGIVLVDFAYPIFFLLSNFTLCTQFVVSLR